MHGHLHQMRNEAKHNKLTETKTDIYTHTHLNDHTYKHTQTQTRQFPNSEGKDELSKQINKKKIVKIY